MVINTNLDAQIGASNLNASQARLSKSLNRLSSGSKIVAPSDDAAGLAVATKFTAQMHRISGAKSNVSNATSFTQTQDGYLGKIAKALDRMSELTILARDETKTDTDRELYNKEFQELNTYLSTAANREFNGVSLFSEAGNKISVTVDSEGTDPFTMDAVSLNYLRGLTGSTSATSNSKASALGIAEGTIQLGASGPSVVVSSNDTLQQIFDRIHAADSNLTASLNETTGKITVTNAGGSAITLTETGTDLLEKGNLAGGSTLTIAAGGYSTSSSAISTSSLANISTTLAASEALTAVKTAINQLAADRARVGSYQTRLNYTAEQLTVTNQNVNAATSRIQDVDVAEESTEMAKANILLQSGTAMLAQANQQGQNVLRLLQ